MPTLQERLLAQVATKNDVLELYGLVDDKFPNFPKDACAATLSVLIQRAGVSVPFETWAQDLADNLENRGWKVIPASKPSEPGDVFVCADGNGNGATDHIGLVVSQSGANFKAADNQMGSHGNLPYKRNVGPGPKTRVNYWLRAPKPAKPKIVVFANGNRVANAQGFKDGDKTFGAIRPIATAMGWAILDINGNDLDLGVGEKVHRLKFEILDGLGFVALGDLRALCDVDFDANSQAVKITST